ncbi:MAG TPA: OmpA family protein [Methylomirabilota bacterium]|nr:OmpA family protein [Methylomirabilota bacterium]
MDTAPQHERGTRSTGTTEIVLLVLVLALAAGGMLATYLIPGERSEASAESVAAAAAGSTPARTPAPSPAAGEARHVDVYFDFKSVRLRAEAVRTLQEQAGLMERSSVWAVLVQGHADRQGPPEYNRLLAQRRAEAVRDFLVDLGVPEASVKVVTIGQEGTLCDDPGRECQQLNRRVHVEIRRLRAAASPALVAPSALIHSQP